MQNSSPTDGSRSDLDPDLAETVAYCAIERLQRRYGDAVTRQAWDEVAACFDPEATVTVDLIDRDPLRFDGGNSIASFIAASVERFSFFEFSLFNSVVFDIDAAHRTASGRVYIMEIRQLAETGRWSHAYGLYRDEYRHTDGQWRHSSRHYSSLARRFDDGTSEVFAIPRQ